MSKEKINDVNYIRNVSGARKKMKPFFLFLVRFAETFAANFIPSAIGISIVFRNPTVGAWGWTSAMVFIVSAILNCTYWYKYVKSRNNPKDFYLMNGTIYMIYAVVSILMLNSKNLGAVIFSILFANLRVCENFGIGTVYSVYITNLFMLFLMMLCERVSSLRVGKMLSQMAENSAEPIEMENVDENLKPTRRKEAVKFMSVEELQRHDEIEVEEDMKKVEAFYGNLPEEIWDKKMTKGHGDEIVFEADDNVEEAENVNINYSSSELWESDIYRGRTPDDAPIREYTDDDEKETDLSKVQNENSPLSQYDSENLWGNISKGTGDGDEDEEPWEDLTVVSVNPNGAYDSDRLWDNITVNPDAAEDEELFEDMPMAYETNPNAGYDSDRLWDNIDASNRGKTEEVKEDDRVNPNADYDPEHLWGNISRGNAETEYDPEQEWQTSSINPNAEYDSEHLWGNLVKGRGTSETPSTDEAADEIDINPNAGYDSEHLWGHIDSSRVKSDDYYEKDEDHGDRFNPNIDYDSEHLWGGDDVSRRRREDDDTENDYDAEKDEINPNADYDTDNMWRNISADRLKPEDYYANNDFNEDDINPNAEYDTDNMWSNIDEKRKKKADDEQHGNDEDINPEKDYSPEQLWDKNLYKGRKKNEE